MYFLGKTFEGKVNVWEIKMIKEGTTINKALDFLYEKEKVLHAGDCECEPCKDKWEKVE